MGGLPSSLNSDKHYIFIRHRPRLLVLLRCGAGESSYSHVQSKILPADPISIQISRQVLGLYCFVALDNGDIYLFEVKTTKDEVGQSCGMSSTTRSELQLLLRFKMEIPHSRNFQLCLSSLLFSGDFIDARVLVVDSRVKIRLITSEESSKVCIALLQKEKGLQATQSFFISWNTNRLSLPLFEAMFGKQLHIWNDDTVIQPENYKGQYVKVIVEQKSNYARFEHMLNSLYDEGTLDVSVIEKEIMSHIEPIEEEYVKYLATITNSLIMTKTTCESEYNDELETYLEMVDQDSKSTIITSGGTPLRMDTSNDKSVGKIILDASHSKIGNYFCAPRKGAS
mgnify:CR=1 FL=1